VGVKILPCVRFAYSTSIHTIFVSSRPLRARSAARPGEFFGTGNYNR